MWLDFYCWSIFANLRLCCLVLFWYGTDATSTPYKEKIRTAIYPGVLTSDKTAKTEIVTKAPGSLVALTPKTTLTPYTASASVCLAGPTNPAAHLTDWGITVAILSALAMTQIPFQTLHAGGIFIRNTASLSICTFVRIYTACILLLSKGMLSNAGLAHHEYVGLVLLIALAQCLLLSVQELSGLFLSLELQSFVLVILCSIYYKNALALEAGRKYFLRSAFSSSLLLLGIGLIYWQTGTTYCPLLSLYVSCSSNEPLLWLGVWLVGLALMWKRAAAPRHLWAADVYSGALSMVSLRISTLPKVAVRLFWVQSWRPIWNNVCGYWLAVFSGASLVVGAVAPLGTYQIKRLLAYSSIGHMGFLLLPLCGGFSGSAAMLVYLIIYLITRLLVWGLMMWSYERSLPLVPGSFAKLVGYAPSVLRTGEEKQLHHTNLNKAATEQNSKQRSRTGNTSVTSLLPSYTGPLVSTANRTNLQYLADLGALNQTSVAGGRCWAFAMWSLAGLPPAAGFFGKLGLFLYGLNSAQFWLVGLALASTLLGSVYYLRILKTVYVDMPTGFGLYSHCVSPTAYVLAVSLGLLFIGLWRGAPLVLFAHWWSLI